MNSIFQSLRTLLRMFCLTGVLALSACASGPSTVDHAFGFDARIDSPNMTILDYRYGNAEHSASAGSTGIKQFGRSPQWENINGAMPLGDTLYVKWQDKTTGQTYEDTVNLKPLLPFSMYLKRIYFVVKGPLLHVYLIEESVPRPTDWPKLGPRKFQYEKTYQIYPTKLP